MTTYYAGIGSRQTPADVLGLMEYLGRRFAAAGITLRSGAAGGADAAFERGCDAAGGTKEIFLPWPGFNGHSSTLCEVSPAAIAMAGQFHPAWNRCSPVARKLHARNCYQVLGPHLDTPVRFLVCWTSGALGGGGTGQAIRIARHHRVPVFDLADGHIRETVEHSVSALIGEIPEEEASTARKPAGL